MGKNAIDLTGCVFGRLTVVARCKSNGHGGRPRWRCECSCGNVVDVPGARLRSGSNKSCGCFRRDRAGELYKKHGKSKTPQYCMFYDARKRAMRLNIPFSILPEDILIPDVCPVFGINLDSSDRNHTPSLDRIKPSMGYTKENICVISFKANRMKGDSSADELRKILSYLERKIQ